METFNNTYSLLMQYPIADQQEALKKLRLPFLPHQIGKLPKPTAKQTEDAKAPKWNGIKCTLCGAWHHPDVVHLDYVGHAAITDRLLDVDPFWFWEPLSLNESGLPCIDKDGGMWIRLTVCGMSRLGYGDAQGKTGGSATKECIGDALRNAAMRFGAALDLWHKGELHADTTVDKVEDVIDTQSPIMKVLSECNSKKELTSACKKYLDKNPSDREQVTAAYKLCLGLIEGAV